MPSLQLRKILVIALARSGYHAVIHWLCNQIPGMVVFMNNCNPELRYRNRDSYKNCGSGCTNIYSFENFDLRGFKKLEMQGRFDDVIIVNRDPYNWIASSLAKGNKKGPGLKLSVLDHPIIASKKYCIYSKWTCESMSRIDMFKQYMMQCLGEEDFLGEKFYHINYNKWFSDVDYREEICKILNLKFNDKGRDYVSPRGGGSSFDGHDFQYQGFNMDVLGRWKLYINNERFNQLLTDDIKEYSRKYFNFNPL